jgi:hypothetical protein
MHANGDIKGRSSGRHAWLLLGFAAVWLVLTLLIVRALFDMLDQLWNLVVTWFFALVFSGG